MARLRIAPIVEGHGEVASIRILLERLWYETLEGEFIRVERPAFKPKGTLRDDADGLRKAVRIALEKLDEPAALPERKMVLILLDSDEPGDDNCPAKMGPRLQTLAQSVDSRIEVACVVANVEYETWFAASAESLVARGYLQMRAGEPIPGDPEGQRLRKKWIEDRFAVSGVIQRGRKYTPPVDQPPMTQAMDLAVCRSRSPSFDKLCRELEKRMAPSGPHE